MVSAEFLDAASRLGERLCTEAIYDGARCTWFGASMEPVGNDWRATRRTFSGEPYAGTSGVALFLGQLHRLRPDDRTRATAIAALEQALDRAAHDTTLARGALYTGTFGIGFAAAETGPLLDRDDLAQRGLALLQQILEEQDDPMFDVVAGAAGRIGALIRLHRRYGQQWMLDAAVAAGRRLLATAERSAAGWSWGMGPSPYLAANLTGYSHGAAGAALALLELHAVTNDEAFRFAAQEAIRYERAAYSPQAKNWPDFRRMVGHAADEPLSYGYAWCHGAPGIGMSRLQAYRLTKDAAVLDEVKIAMESTRASNFANVLEGTQGICHGVAGNAELFLQAFEVLGDEDALAYAEAIARDAWQKYSDGPWPCGLDAGGEAPGLMLGLAGIGYFYLRLHARGDVPSLLTIGS